MDQKELTETLLAYLNSYGTTESFIDWAVNCEEEKDEDEVREAIRKITEDNW